MNTPPRKYPEYGLHAPVYKAINRIIDYVKEISPQNGYGIKTSRTMNGTVLSLNPVKSATVQAAGEVIQYRVKSIADDHLVCREFDGTSETGADVLIAKPYNLRRTGWHGIAVTYTLEPYPGAPATMTITYTYVTAVYRTASISVGGASGTEHQVIIPRYVANKSIIFASGVSNGTGVSGADLVDINADGRAWGRIL